MNKTSTTDRARAGRPRPHLLARVASARLKREADARLKREVGALACALVLGSALLPNALSPNAGLAAQESAAGDTVQAAAGDFVLHIVEGTVLDEATTAPLAAVIVVLPGINRTTFTDELGQFRIEGVPSGVHPLTMIRIGYETFEGSFIVDGDESLAVLMTQGAIELEGIEVKVRSREDLEWRASGTRLSVIGPLEMEELRERYFSLGDLLAGRFLSGARFVRGTGGTAGCMRSSRARGGRCARIVLDGVMLDSSAGEWVYDMSAETVFAVRFVSGPEAALRYGTTGGSGVLMVETRYGRR